MPILGVGAAVPVVPRGGGGGAPPWTPAALPLAAWYDPSDAATLTLAGSAVAQLRDKSGAGVHLDQGDPGSRPQLAAGAINGRAAVLCAGGVTQLLLASGAYGLGTAWEIYAVVSYGNYAVGDSNEVLAFDEVGGGMLGFAGGGMRIGRSRVAWDVFHGTSPTVGQHVAGWRLAGGVYTTYLDGADGGTTTAAQAVSAAFRLAPRADNVADTLFGEIVIASAALTAGERASLLGYLKGRWNTP